MKALVTGGGGFLGRAIVRELVANGAEVRSFSRGVHAELVALGVQCERGDLRDREALERAMQGVDTVFHCAAMIGIRGAAAEFFDVNVRGTENVLAACWKNGVERLVYTSSPSVCFDGKDHVLAKNDLPYAERFAAHYPATKAQAERLVLASNGVRGLFTCALRPHLVFGPGDPHLVPRIIERARAKRLVIVGAGTNEVSLTYVDNAAHAHVCAAESLHPRALHAGRAYFIAQREPVVLWRWIADLVARLELPAVRRRVPLAAAWTAGAALEWIWRATDRESDPPMTRFLALQLARSHSYDQRPAERDFGYRERIGMEAATERLVASLHEPVASGV